MVNLARESKGPERIKQLGNLKARSDMFDWYLVVTFNYMYRYIIFDSVLTKLRHYMHACYINLYFAPVEKIVKVAAES